MTLDDIQRTTADIRENAPRDWVAGDVSYAEACFYGDFIKYVAETCTDPDLAHKASLISACFEEHVR